VPDLSALLAPAACRIDGAGTAIMGICRIFESIFPMICLQ
jgi:hypothetical protein